MLAMCFTGLFVHGFLSDSMLEIVLVPVIKDKTGRIDQVDNYRPYLFNVYVDDLSQTLNRCRTGCLSGNMTINHIMYDNDLVLLSQSATWLRELLCACEEFSISHDVVYNSKTSSVLMCRNKAMAHAAPPVFTVNCSIIGESDKVKYLGHIICNDMSDDDDMMRQKRQLYAQGNVLSRRVHVCSLEVNNVLFRTFCTPLYTCQLWFRYIARSLHKLYVAYNNAFRMMHHLPTYCSASEMFTVNRVPNCAAVIRNLTFRRTYMKHNKAIVALRRTSMPNRILTIFVCSVASVCI